MANQTDFYPDVDSAAEANGIAGLIISWFFIAKEC